MSKDHPWHSISPGDNIPDIVNAIIEIPKGSKAKYEIDKGSGLFTAECYCSIILPWPFRPSVYSERY